VGAVDVEFWRRLLVVGTDASEVLRRWRESLDGFGVTSCDSSVLGAVNILPAPIITTLRYVLDSCAYAVETSVRPESWLFIVHFLSFSLIPSGFSTMVATTRPGGGSLVTGIVTSCLRWLSILSTCLGRAALILAFIAAGMFPA
jgi:hypothetical protein